MLSKDGSGSVSLTNNTGLTVGTVDGVNGVSGSTVDLRTSTGDLTLDQVVTATGSGDAVVLSTPGNFINHAGDTAVRPTDTSGRWLIYSNAPAGKVFGDLVSNGTAL